MELIIVTGLSGAGKSKVVNTLEDLGYFCVDNVPPQMLEKFAQLGRTSQGNTTPSSCQQAPLTMVTVLVLVSADIMMDP